LEWEKAIDKDLRTADIILLLISPTFMATDFVDEKEIGLAVERHERGEARVIPIIVRPADWEWAPFGKVQPLPEEAKPITEWSNRDEAWLKVASGIRKAIRLLERFEQIRAEPREYIACHEERQPVTPNVTAASSSHRLKAFLCHSSADKPAVRQLYERLQAKGIEPWLDVKNILPGQDWDLEIRRAVRDSHVVLVCLSNQSTTRAGYLQKEIKFVLDRADEQPEGTIFVIPLKLEECEMPDRLSRWHWVNFFEEDGYELLMRSLRYRAKQLGLERHLVSNPGGEGNFVEALRYTLVDRVEAGDPLINKSEVEAIAAAHGLNEIQASQIFRSLEGKLWHGSIIKISDEPVPRDWAAVNDLEVLH
jgi:hypothetical protein